MVRVILERSFNTPLPMPMTYEAWKDMHQQVDSCLYLRGVSWIRSLISKDGCRCICEFEAPHADAVQEACRESGTAFERVWRAEILPGAESDTTLSCQSPIAAEVRYDPPMTKEVWDIASQKALPCYRELEVRRFFSFMSPDGKQSICLFEASSADAVRSVYRKVGIPFKQIWRSQLITPTQCQ
ncbi:MAG TPA: nickel-binding protein [Allocoleopsis sp.]